MLHEKKYYTIDLEDYGYPRQASVTRLYCGTMDDLVDFANRLETQPWTQERYNQIIDGIDFYDLDYDVTHYVVGKEVRLLTPVKVLALHEAVLEEPRWQHTAYSDAVYAMQAGTAYVSQLLLECQDGTLIRCAKVSFENLMLCAHGFCWCNVQEYIRGFPGIVTWDQPMHNGHLYVQLCTYSKDQLGDAMKDLHTVTGNDLSALTQDILGEG